VSEWSKVGSRKNRKAKERETLGELREGLKDRKGKGGIRNVPYEGKLAGFRRFGAAHNWPIKGVRIVKHDRIRI